MATDFKFTLEDLMSGSMTDVIQREVQKYGKTPLKTSFMANGPNFNTPDLVTFSDLMQNIPTYDSSQNLAAKQNAAIGTFTQFLTGSLPSDAATTDSSVQGLYSKNIPEDLKKGAAQAAQNNNTTTGPGHGWVENPTGAQQQDAQLAGTYVLQSPNVQFDNTTSGNQAKSEIAAGQISPNVLYVLNILSQTYAFKISAAKDGNFPATALNFSGKAIEIDEVQDPSNQTWVRVGPNSQMIKAFVTLINTITGPQRPTEVGCPWTANALAGGGTPWSGFDNTPALANQYQDHIHIGNTDWGDVIPAAGGQTSTAGSAVVAFARTQIGVPYQLGGTTAGVNLDCSGLALDAYKAAGITLPRVAQDQYNAGPVIDISTLQPGDLVFFASSNNTTSITHVGIYVGNSQMIDAPHTGANVRQESFTPTLGAKWGSEFFVGATRPKP